MIEYLANESLKTESKKNYFSNNDLEELMLQIKNTQTIVNYENIATESHKKSYITGIDFVMNNLFKIYEKVNDSFGGSIKIIALNSTINKKVLSSFLKEIKNDLKINYNIFGGGKLDIPIAYEVIKKIKNNFSDQLIDDGFFMLGVKKANDLIYFAYNAPLTSAFKNYIKNESKNVVKIIANTLNDL